MKTTVVVLVSAFVIFISVFAFSITTIVQETNKRREAESKLNWHEFVCTMQDDYRVLSLRMDKLCLEGKVQSLEKEVKRLTTKLDAYKEIFAEVPVDIPHWFTQTVLLEVGEK